MLNKIKATVLNVKRRAAWSKPYTLISFASFAYLEICLFLTAFPAQIKTTFFSPIGCKLLERFKSVPKRKRLPHPADNTQHRDLTKDKLHPGE